MFGVEIFPRSLEVKQNEYHSIQSSSERSKREAEQNDLEDKKTSTEATSQTSRALGRIDPASFVQCSMFVVAV